MSNFTHQGIGFYLKSKKRKTISFKVLAQGQVEVQHPVSLKKEVVREIIIANFSKVEKALVSFLKVEKEVETFAPNEKISLEQWQRKAQEKIRSCAFLWAEKMKVEPSYVKVKDMKSRWGSCTGKDGINLNIRLAYTPTEVLSYVVIHELSHITFKHHQKDFWKRVEIFDKDYKAHQKWLRENGGTIMKIPLGWVKGEV